MTTPQDVLSFWLDEIGPSGWYVQKDEIDESIRSRFFDLWEFASKAECEGSKLKNWFETPETVLALLIVLDQFPRNMFRDDARAFSTDAKARSVAKKAIEKGWDKRVAEPQRQFFYMPLMHSECLMDQDRAVRLFATRMTGDNLDHAKAHREIIRLFGRFPYRNQALDRDNTASEAEFLGKGGYRSILNEIQEAA